MAPLLTATMAVALGLLLPPTHAGETGLDPLAQWPQWRGPLGTGVKYLRNRNARVTQARESIAFWSITSRLPRKALSKMGPEPRDCPDWGLWSGSESQKPWPLESEERSLI